MSREERARVFTRATESPPPTRAVERAAPDRPRCGAARPRGSSSTRCCGTRLRDGATSSSGQKIASQQRTSNGQLRLVQEPQVRAQLRVRARSRAVAAAAERAQLGLEEDRERRFGLVILSSLLLSGVRPTPEQPRSFRDPRASGGRPRPRLEEDRGGDGGTSSPWLGDPISLCATPSLDGPRGPRARPRRCRRRPRRARRPWRWRPRRRRRRCRPSRRGPRARATRSEGARGGDVSLAVVVKRGTDYSGRANASSRPDASSTRRRARRRRLESR